MFQAAPARAPRFNKFTEKYGFTRDKKRIKSAISQVAFAGDKSKEAQHLLQQLLTDRNPDGNITNIAMEPFEVVRDML